MIKEDEYASRPFTVIARKELGPEILRPEQVLLSLPESVLAKPLDIGSLCFSKRAQRSTTWNKSSEVQVLPVVLNSLVKHRREFLARYLDKVAVSGLRDTSVEGEIRAIIQVFEWVDDNGHSDFLASVEAAEKAYISYTDHLYHQIQNEVYNPTTASRYQKALLQIVIGLMFPNAVNRIKGKTYDIRSQKAKVRAPSAKKVDEYLAYLVPFVRGLRWSLMNDDFPMLIKGEEWHIYLYPTNDRSFYNSAIHSDESPFYGIYDLPNGRILSREEYENYKLSESNRTLGGVRQTYKLSLERFEKFNSDRKRSYYRATLAQRVIEGYARILQCLTGMNTGPLVNLLHKDAISVAKGDVKKDVITIKHRAKGRVEPYPIGGNRGLKILKEYLEFRDWYLDGVKCEFLFFNGSQTSKFATPLHPTFQGMFFKQLKGKLFPEHVENLTPSQARKHKNIVLKRLGATNKEASSHLNHSEKTNDLHYSAPSIDESGQELAQFWTAVKQSAEQVRLIASDADVKDQSITVGHCDDMGNPQAFNNDTPITPNCRTQFGCLYCEHYACHADVEDVRKLLCLKYVIEAIREQSEDFEAADTLFKGLCLRAEALLDRMSDLYPEMADTIKDIRREVFDLGILTPFWESRLSRYEEMGVLL